MPLLRRRFLRPFLYLILGRENVVEAVEAADDFERLAREQARGSDPIFFHAPVVLAAHVPCGAYFGREDAVYAACSLMLAAQRLGLGTCHIGYVNAAMERNSGLPSIFGVPPERQLELVLILGYSRFKFRRALPRRRKDLTWNPPQRGE